MIQENAANCIAILVDRRTGREYNISRFATSLGRDQGSDFALSDDKTVSRHHATITFADGKFHILDLASKNGTKINGCRLSERTELVSGDEITIGLSQLIFVLLPNHCLESTKAGVKTETIRKPARNIIPALSY